MVNRLKFNIIIYHSCDTKLLMTIRGGHFFNTALNLLLEYPRVLEHRASNSESLTAKYVEVTPEDK